MTEQTTLTPIEAINEFYRLKYKYESGYYEKYVKPIIRSAKSKREKRIEYSKLPKHECINCKRNVGTIFNIKLDKKEQLRIFSAKCGDIQDSCPLDIQINYSTREQMNTLIKEGLSEIENIKLNIIKEKNNSLFFKTNVVELFNKLTAELKLETENTGFIIETNILKNDNPEKVVLLRQTIDEFGKGFILPFKQMIKDFDETNNQLVLNQAVNFYINEMIPKLKEIMLLKYDVSMVEYDELNNIYKLIQLPNSLESNEYYLPGDDKIVKFVRGVKKQKKKTRKDDSELNPKNKTRKIKPVADLVLEDEEEEIIKPSEEIIKPSEEIITPSEEIITPSEEIVEEQLESKYAEQPNKKPIFDESGNVTWSNETYDKLWKVIPNKLKELLLQDHDWLEDYMNTCVKLTKDGKPCKLFLPKQAQFPPVKNADAKYDFGSEIVNKLFNRLGKTHQETLLTVYTVKDGVKNYDSLKDTLASILAKEINFERGYF
jgi:hypothetical protein